MSENNGNQEVFGSSDIQQQDSQSSNVQDLKDTGIENFKDLGLDKYDAKELSRLEQQFGIRPDFHHKGKPGFFAKNEKEWFANMKATRQRLRFSRDSKISEFLRKHPGRDFYVRNPNKKYDYMYPVNRRKR